MLDITNNIMSISNSLTFHMGGTQIHLCVQDQICTLQNQQIHTGTRASVMSFFLMTNAWQTVGFGDQLYFQRLGPEAQSDEFDCNMDGVPTDKSNLVLKALDLFRNKTRQQTFYKVFLDKRVPAQAGLGGGSGNAATALFAANELAGSPATLEDLIIWSADLGSDITFFLSSGTCYCTGRGEILHPQKPLVPSKLWLVKPMEGLSTPAVFKNLDYDKLSDSDPLELLQLFMEQGIDGAKFVNDLEPAAFKAMPLLSEIKEDLQGLGFQHVLMSGSGSTIFCLGASPHTDPCWMEDFAEKWGAMVCETTFINRSIKSNTWYTAP
ncbi:unnamed protein product [Choristocarpus tenellus]